MKTIKTIVVYVGFFLIIPVLMSVGWAIKWNDYSLGFFIRNMQGGIFLFGFIFLVTLTAFVVMTPRK